MEGVLQHTFRVSRLGLNLLELLARLAQLVIKVFFTRAKLLADAVADLLVHVGRVALVGVAHVLFLVRDEHLEAFNPHLDALGKESQLIHAPARFLPHLGNPVREVPPTQLVLLEGASDLINELGVLPGVCRVGREAGLRRALRLGLWKLPCCARDSPFLQLGHEMGLHFRGRGRPVRGTASRAVLFVPTPTARRRGCPVICAPRRVGHGARVV
mmetsp:Transcript_17538/g.44481  ORF Transcript_17538/g.44481 Transcript_17538/m.44481 type:complete len:214 (+) Transcript_17538:581-1222(+)